MDSKEKHIKNILKKPIILVGLMGSGKSVIGKMLAVSLGMGFIDSDKVIEKSTGMSIPEIFKQHGEQAFRQLEKETIQKLLSEPPQVIATGGGAITNKETAKTIWEKSISIWLKPDIETILERTQDDTNRPLLNVKNPKETLENLANERYPIYAKADITVNSYNEKPEQTLERLITALHKNLASRNSQLIT